MAEERVRLAIVGTGGIANAHVVAFQRIPEHVQIVALSEIVPGKAREFAARHGLTDATILGDYRELMDLPGVDAVDICLRPEGHGPASLAALAARKHVLCEKPMATSVAEAKQMADAARDSNLVTMVDFTYRYYPAAQFIRKVIDDGQIGEVFRVRVEYLRDAITGVWGQPRDPRRRPPDPTQPAQNIVGDLGSHIIDLARYFAGEVSRVHGQYRLFGETNESMIATVDFAGGAVGSIEATHVATGRGGNYRRVEVHGTKGAAIFWFTRPSLVQLYSVDGVTSYTRDFAAVTVPGVPYTEDDAQAWYQGLANAGRMFARAIQTGTKVRADFHDGYMSNVIMDAIHQSSRTGVVVNVGAAAG